MSSSSFFQGLQSCLEPRLIESRVMRLKLTPPDPNSSKTSRASWADSLIHSVSVPPETLIPQKETLTASSSTKTDSKAMNDVHENGVQNNKGSQKVGWSFLDAVRDDAANVAKKEKESEKVYVHPAVKRSCSTLSAQSLEMCTEGLGCETGSNASDISDDMALLSLESQSYHSKQSSYENKLYVPKKLEPRSRFPPPLTSITDFNGVQVRPHREEGRLVLKAVNVSSHNSYFHAERANGRLQLRLMKNFEQETDDAPDEGGVDENCEIEAEAENEEVVDEGYGSHQEETETSWSAEELEGNIVHVEDEMGIGKFSRPSRCNEDGSGKQVLLNWERLWVAT